MTNEEAKAEELLVWAIDDLADAVNRARLDIRVMDKEVAKKTMEEVVLCMGATLTRLEDWT